MPWDEENVSRLKELWDQGLPTAQIGKLLGFTKNAVVGKAHRTGLERRPSPIRRSATKPDRKKARSPLVPKLNFEKKNGDSQENIDTSNKFQPVMKDIFLTKQKRGCEWPLGHPEEKDFRFCNNERFSDKPYCLEHCAIAYVFPEKEEESKLVNQVA